MRLGKGVYKDVKFLVLKMQDNFIQIDAELTNLATLDELIPKLPPKNTRFICYLLSFEMPTENTQLREGIRSKIMFLTWCPDETNVWEKFLFTAATNLVKKKFKGMTGTIQCSHGSEIDESLMIEKCLTFMK
ncbi:predicted protein [Naegleria gruberi]|uniref:Predicted protein n=1 Tax=Naegleria gruberi TaxID=5762 RepID=D2VWN6_NAEGR|nr:uncharacterized protein NAEGRDRAFT_73445 [Naegleria gruberi]EFC38727.1 predicted protein [Naegleria gruberi]|eukprot:XP_002671471.1 predicted protein [Naegleria gruberi strain NEG-M]